MCFEYCEFLSFYTNCLFCISDRSGNASGEEEENGLGTCKDSDSVEKHRRKKHKHHSKRKKHKSSSLDEKKHKHRHKHKKRKRRDSSRVKDGAVEETDETVALKRSRLDDLAALEDLEKQRALIQAELDNELMEGKVHSGMGLILQGYNSGSDDDVQEQTCNGDEQKKNLEQLYIAGKQESQSVAKDAEQSQHSSVDDERMSPWRHSGRSKSKDKVVHLHKSDRKKNRTESDTDNKDRTQGPCPSLEKRPSHNIQQPKDGHPKSRSPAISRKQNNTQKDPQSVGAETEPGSKREPSSSIRQAGSTRSTDHSKSPEKARRSRSKDRHGRLPDPDRKRDRDKTSVKSPCKEVSSGKENRSPHRRHMHSPVRDRLSRRSRERHSPQQSSNCRSATRNRSPARRERSRSADRRRRESDRQRLSPVRFESNASFFYSDVVIIFSFNAGSYSIISFLCNATSRKDSRHFHREH